MLPEPDLDGLLDGKRVVRVRPVGGRDVALAAEDARREVFRIEVPANGEYDPWYHLVKMKKQPAKPKGRGGARRVSAEDVTVVVAPDSRTTGHFVPGGGSETGDETQTSTGRDTGTGDGTKQGKRCEGRFHYMLERRIGKGGMGSVYLASCLDDPKETPNCPPRKVAIKFFDTPQDMNPFELLKRELSAVVALRHERIPAVYDWNLKGKRAFAVHQYYAGGSLAQELQMSGPLEEAAVWHLLEDLLEALNAAHRGCILHLDIKPQNVLLDDCGGYALADFGISQGYLVSRRIISSGLGAPAYQAPEQRRGQHEAFDSRTDLWGVGITAWTAWTGVRLSDLPILPVRDLGDVHEMPRLSLIRPGCSPELEDIVRMLLVNDQSRRPGSAAEVLAMVQNFRNRKTAERHPARGMRMVAADDPELKGAIEGLMDPLWVWICATQLAQLHFVKFEEGELLCNEQEKSYFAFALLRGQVSVERRGKVINVESREGTMLGEITTLTGGLRTATLRAIGPVWACVFNAAELELFVSRNPAVGIRLIKLLSERLSREAGRSGETG